MGISRGVASFIFGFILILFEGCAQDPSIKHTCAPSILAVQAGSDGNAFVFSPDPIAASGNLALNPISSHLNEFRTPVTLSRLKGNGTLDGKFISVSDVLNCQGRFGAFDAKNQFLYSHGDSHFQETMAYYFGDLFQEGLHQSGYLLTKDSLKILVHCGLEDNSFYFRGKNEDGQLIEGVCLDDSLKSPGASYADDGAVTMHELQHATTSGNYSDTIQMGQLYYDEAGALNEAISDFMSLMFTDSRFTLNSAVDARVFSRWALGTFDPEKSHLRGAHRCPVYDSKYPSCDDFPRFSVADPIRKKENTVSYIYPDGMGWPYPNNYSSENTIEKVFEKYGSQEEIHNAAVLMTGALWDIYSQLKKNHGEAAPPLSQAITQLVMESVRHLPSPNFVNNRSPINYIIFAQNLLAYAESIPFFTPVDLISIREMLTARGLAGYPELKGDWMEVGAGTNLFIQNSASPGVFILDSPTVLKKWLEDLNRNPAIIPQSPASGSNFQLDPGEVAALWFDIQNNSEWTAGSVLLTVTSDDPDLKIMDGSLNRGYLTLSGKNSAQVVYGKINGTSIVSALTPSRVKTGNSYFKTNLNFSGRPTNAIWVKVSEQAPHGKRVALHVRAEPSNGIANEREFWITLQ